MIHTDLEEALEKLPDEVAHALKQWREATLHRETVEAKLYLFFKGEDKERSAAEIRALVHQHSERYQAVLQEISFEATYKAREETLMAKKKEAALRTHY